MASFSELLTKIAKNESLTPQEMDELKRFGTDTQQRNSFVAGNTTAENTLNVKFPFFPIYSETLQANTATLEVRIASGFKHLLVITNGRTTDAGTSAVGLRARYNGDTGSNYNTHVYPSTTQVGTTSAVLGTLTQDTTEAVRASASYAIIANYLGAYNKNALLYSSINVGGAVNPLIIEMTVSAWESTAPIETITFIPNAGSIKAGATIAIYGVF